MRHRLLSPLVLAVAVAAIAAGCGGGGSKNGAATPATPGQTKASIYNDPARFVLTEQDVPTGYVLDAQNTRAITNQDSAKGRGDAYLRQILSWGRIAGYASSWRPGKVDVQGPLQVFSTASTYDNVGGAEDAFAQGLKEVSSAYKRVDSKGVGDESRMLTRVLDGPNGKLTQYAIVWRRGQVIATIAATSLQDTVSADDALAFAQKQEKRIEAGEQLAAVGK